MYQKICPKPAGLGISRFFNRLRRQDAYFPTAQLVTAGTRRSTQSGQHHYVRYFDKNGRLRPVAG